MALDGSDTSSIIYINSLNPINPSGTDNKAEGDDHIRYIKRVLKNTFPNVSGIVSPTHTELNYVDGVTSSIQTQFNTINTSISTINTSISTINTALANFIPSGTYMLFVQTSAPTGWTKQTTHNDKTLRVVSGTAASGGSVAFSTLFNRTTTDGFGLTTSHIPSHTHSFEANTGTESADHSHYVSVATDSQGAHNHYVVWQGTGTTGGVSSATYVATMNAGNTGDYNYQLWNTTSSANAGLSSWNGAHTHTAAGWSGGRSAAHTHYVSATTSSVGNGANPTHAHGMDMRVTYVDVIICRKD